MGWISIILALLQLANKLFDIGQQQKWIGEGEEQAAMKAAAEILRKSQYAKKALEEFAGEPDADLDDFLHNLEPRDPNSK